MKIKFILIKLSLLFTLSAHADCLLCGVKDTFIDAFDNTGLIILGVGAVSTAVAFNHDQQVNDSWINYQRMNRETANFGNFWGTGIPEASIALVQLFVDNKKGIAHTESLIVSTVLTYALKYSTSRPRPSSENRLSFPSGHSQVSFVTAAHFHFAYGFLYSLPFYGAAAVTGLSRLADNAHWLSDVVAGATIGILFGRSSLKHNALLTPLAYEGGGYGLQVSYTF